MEEKERNKQRERKIKKETKKERRKEKKKEKGVLQPESRGNVSNRLFMVKNSL